ncbi:MAG TPA: bifunctional hydroxymethylpyrimidine kinase/phosphomethylpyrimidine kinase [Blastocatellia bacterium]|nr:bifunctional hydroxymethylpyrimidine kinase/phosphomethylpyrimidine kinase [Blastocatellia bacterium]
MITVMTIAGFDPSAGAGILADIKTMSAFGCYGVAAITSLTLQNTQGVFGAHHQTREVVRGQLEPLFDDFDIAAVKTGMLPTRDVIEEVADALSSKAIAHVVVDPVVRSTSGYDLIDDRALAALIDLLLPMATVVTPNRAEAERITGAEVATVTQMESAARRILALGSEAVLIKGGEIEGEQATDLLLDSSGVTTFSAERVDSTSTHGTGCTLASALACLMASGLTLREAVPAAKQYVVEAIKGAPGLGHGHGPLSHFPRKLNDYWI